METPIVKTKKGLSPIWVLPILALILGGWLLYKDYKESGFMISVQIKDASGLTAGKTKVLFKGLPVGTLTGFSVSPNLEHINAKIEMIKESREELTMDSKFWVVRPEVSLNGIAGLDTLVKGSYFEVQPGTSKKTAISFIALDETPPLSKRVPGLHLTLSSPLDASLGAGSPVYFKKVAVGEVVSNILQEDSSIETKILIYPRYKNHISTSTRFFISSGIKLEANLPKISFHIDPLKTIIQGGISFFTPPGGGTIEDTEKILPLYANQQTAMNADNISIDLRFSVENGLTKDAEILYNGVKIGSIHTVKLIDDFKTVHAKAYIDKDLGHLLRENTYIYAVRAKFNAGGVSNLDTIMSGPYLNLIAGNGKTTHSFFVHPRRPVNMTVTTGLNLVLETDRLGSLGYNKPIYYRQVQVGHTTGYELSPTGQNVLVYINIHPPYVNLIRENTKFWNSTGFRIKGGLMTSLKISTESLATLIDGGISFSTPENDAMGDMVINGHHFPLNNDPDDSWLNWSPALELGDVPERLKKDGDTKEEKR